MIAESRDNLLHRLDVAAKHHQVVPLNTAYKAVTSDVITAYCFGESTGYLMQENYNSPLFDAVFKMFQIAWLMTHIAWLGPLLDSIPMRVQAMLMPGMRSYFRMKSVSLRILASSLQLTFRSDGGIRLKRFVLQNPQMRKQRLYSMASSIVIYLKWRKRPIDCDRRLSCLFKQAKILQVIDFTMARTELR